MEYRFEDILEIRNGKNQKAVENPEGRYPIYGSGGVIGYADDYICEADTIIIGRKGSINNPIYASEPFWNVDTAFGLSVKKDFVLPRYLYYFCKRFDFEKLNKTVTIPSLTKSDLLKIKINLPVKDEQQAIIDRLMKIESIMEFRKTELDYLDVLIKARFVEMFGDRYVNDKNWNTTKLRDSVSFNNGKAHEQVVDEMGEYILVTSRAIASDFEDVRRTNVLLFPLHKNDIVMVMSDVPNGKALAKCQLIEEDDKYTLNQRICSFDNYNYNPVFLLYLLSRHPYFLSFNDGNGQTNLRKSDILECELIVPPIKLQEQFATFVVGVDKSKVVIMNIRIFVQATAKRIEVKNKMTQKEYVIEAMRRNGGYATFQQLNQMVDFSTWKTKTPQASIRQIVQVYDEFFRIRPGLWALTECKDDVLRRFDIVENDAGSDELFTHSYYQGIIVELGNMHNYTTYVPNQDKNKKFLEKKLCEITTEPELPDFTYEAIRNRAKTVDVIWFNERRMPFRFYEVEHSTNITNSLDKFYELQDFRADFYIIADESRRSQFNSLMERNIYSSIRNYVRFFNYNNLINQYSKESALMQMDRL